MNQLQRTQLSRDNERIECDCFGQVQPVQQFFLVKHSSTQTRQSHIHQYPPTQDVSSHLSKSNSKRSLKKNHHLSPQPTLESQRQVHFDDYHTSRNMQQEMLRNQTKLFCSPKKKSYQNGDVVLSSQQYFGKPLQNPLQNHNMIKVSSCQKINIGNQIYYPSQVPVTPIKFNTQVTAIPQVKIHFNQSPAMNGYSPAMSPRTWSQKNIMSGRSRQQVEVPSLTEMKEDVKIKIIEIEKQKNQMKKQKKQRNQELIQKMDTLKIKSSEKDVLKSIIRMDPLKSRIDIKKSGINTQKSRIAVKSPKSKQLPNPKFSIRRMESNKTALTNMDEVEQIHSLIDQNEKEDSDVQSVVLGRLNEYGSMVDPSIADSTPTLASKLISMNTQCSTIGKSYFKPVQFPYQRKFK